MKTFNSNWHCFFPFHAINNNNKDYFPKIVYYLSKTMNAPLLTVNPNESWSSSLSGITGTTVGKPYLFDFSQIVPKPTD